MVTHQNTELTSAEISNLWISYQNDTMANCGIKYFLANIEDVDIQTVLEYALKISQEHIQKVTKIFMDDDYPVPHGFKEELDLNLNAPRLFSDKYYLQYILNMGKFGLTSYSLALSLSSRKDVIDYYTSCLEETTILHNQAKDMAIKKGIYIRPPSISKPDRIDFVRRQSFLSGWLDRRPLLGIEIANLVYNAERNALGQALIAGFSQVAKSKEVRKYFERGRDLAGKHLEVFDSILHDNFLSGTMNMTSEVTNSTTPPFSDKLMMYHISALIASGMGQYGVATSASPRRDLGVNYARLASEIALYAEDGANIMIKNGWMEQPPEAADRKKLAKKE